MARSAVEACYNYEACYHYFAGVFVLGPAISMRVTMTRFTSIALLCGAILLAGCNVSTEGVSLSEFKWVDNNCTGNGFITNPAWCHDELKPSMGPYAK